MPAAFFDLDRTVLAVNSATLWARHELTSGNISARQFARACVWNLLYHLSVIDIERAFGEAVNHYRGRSYDDLQQETRAWFFRHVATRVRPAARRAVRDHKDRQHKVLLLTSSSCFEASVAAEQWEFDGYLANDFPTDEKGRLLGTVRAPLCYGPGKVERARGWARENRIDLSECYFYTDSYTDVPMLKAVGHPRVVCPDPRLRREARRRRWPILQW